ncbi:MAG: AraC family transcriptional regulator [Bifidobacteriaceae bacterium]|jgi:AraC-like DNA-binding protein|nr:AraC family transcriptional regulator [Bifidobacteriaceae bacterium]
MKPAEHKVLTKPSDLYIYTPSKTARSTFLYALRVGFYVYEPGYKQERTAFDSFLLMYVKSGCVQGTTGERSFEAREGQFVLIDCYEHHSYSMAERTEISWLHFDGISARPYFEYIVGKLTNVFTVRDPIFALNRLQKVFDTLAAGKRFSEVSMAKYIFDILTELATFAGEPGAEERRPHVIEDVVAYISQHLSERLTVSELAERSYMSEYHFIRTFKKETGYTPHAYIMEARMNVAKFLLTNSEEPIKVILEKCGFSDLSVFGAAFRKRTGLTASEYRERGKKEK